MDPSAYLDRIGHARPSRADALTLASLHRAHLQTVPFENLDVHRGKPIRLDEEAILRKLVQERRGGFCYELNAAFAWLLRALGFRVSYLSAATADERGVFGPDFAHMALRVDLPEGAWLADVGFGDCFVAPLRLELGTTQPDPTGNYRLVAAADRIILERHDGLAWRPQYSLAPQPRALAQFEPMCHYTQTSPDSIFVKKRVVTLARPDGRVSLRDDRLIVVRGSERTERPLAPGEWERALTEHFALD